MLVSLVLLIKFLSPIRYELCLESFIVFMHPLDLGRLVTACLLETVNSSLKLLLVFLNFVLGFGGEEATHLVRLTSHLVLALVQFVLKKDYLRFLLD